jgi:hypothetical protein
MDGGRGMVGGAGVGAERDCELRGDSLLSGTGGDASGLGHLYTVSLLSSSARSSAPVMAGRIFTMWREVREVSGREMHGSQRQSKLHILSPSLYFA